jgi:bacterioferritin-associated ferredoxin
VTDVPAPGSAAEPTGLRIDRCVCRNRRFADLLSEARSAGHDLHRLMRATGCGEQCGLCRPYLRRMLSTGQVVFRQPLDPDAE